MKCLICKKHYNHLGSHIWHKHKILAKEYKMSFGLDIGFPLISNEIKIKKQEHFQKHRKKYLKNLTKNYCFKKGKINRDYFSDQSILKANKNLIKINSQQPKNCPICNLKTKHLTSHLYNAHSIKMIKIKK